MELTDTISEKMSDIFKPQRKFIPALLTTIYIPESRNPGEGTGCMTVKHASGATSVSFMLYGV